MNIAIMFNNSRTEPSMIMQYYSVLYYEQWNYLLVQQVHLLK